MMERQPQPSVERWLAHRARRIGRFLVDKAAMFGALSGPPEAARRYLEIREELRQLRTEGEAVLDAGWRPGLTEPTEPAQVRLSRADRRIMSAFRTELADLTPQHFETTGPIDN